MWIFGLILAVIIIIGIRDIKRVNSSSSHDDIMPIYHGNREYRFQISGQSNYQSNLAQLNSSPNIGVKPCLADITTNLDSPEKLDVKINGLLVGYIPRSEVTQNPNLHINATVLAVIYRNIHPRQSLGVKLCLIHPTDLAIADLLQRDLSTAH